MRYIVKNIGNTYSWNVWDETGFEKVGEIIIGESVEIINYVDHGEVTHAYIKTTKGAYGYVPAFILQKINMNATANR